MFPCKTIAGVLSLVSAGLLSAHDFEYYNVTFTTPPHTVGLPPATGVGFLGPSAVVFGRPTVVSEFGHLQDQPLLFTAIGYDQIQFNLGHRQSNYYLEFDFESRNLNPSLFAFTALFDTPHVQNVHLHGGPPQFYAFSGIPGHSTSLGTWTDGELHHLRIEADLLSSTFTITLDDQAPRTAPFMTSGGDVQSIRLNLGTWRAETSDDPTVQIAIDNIVIGTVPIPEPATYGLLALGLVALLARGLSPRK